jgi:hypothetical protein
VTSQALRNWKTDRAARLNRLVAAHRTLRGMNRRWITDELNHSLILRLASEFQGFARELHDETSMAVVAMIAPNNVAQQTALQLPYFAVRLLDRGNARPETLNDDFGRFGFQLWAALDARYPRSGPRWRRDLTALNTARNALAHDNHSRLAPVTASGWRLTLPFVSRWCNALDGLARGMDHVVGKHIHSLFGVRPW